MTTRRLFTVVVSPETVIDGELGPGEVAIVDAVDRTTATWWGEVHRDSDAAAAELRAVAADVVATARRAVADVAGIDDVAVVGDGVLAGLLRRLLGVEACTHAGPQHSAVIDGAGTERAVATALASAASGGLVVLAAEPERPCLDVRTYGDIHARGLTVAGLSSGGGLAGAVDESDVDWVLAELVDAVLGRPCAAGPWYRVVAADVVGD